MLPYKKFYYIYNGQILLNVYFQSKKNLLIILIQDTRHGSFQVSLKGFGRMVSNDTPFKDGKARLAMVPLIPTSDKKCGRYCRFSTSLIISI